MSRLTGLDFIVDKSAWHKTRFIETEVSTDLAPGQVLFRVDRFAFTANNISYALAGDMLHYWDFFPQEGGWGCLPTMGYGDVVASAHEVRAITAPSKLIQHHFKTIVPGYSPNPRARA